MLFFVRENSLLLARAFAFNLIVPELYCSSSSRPQNVNKAAPVPRQSISSFYLLHICFPVQKKLHPPIKASASRPDYCENNVQVRIPLDLHL